MDADLIAFLAEATVAGSVAMLLVLALRLPVRALLGATAAYSLWLCVPIALLAVLLPRGVDVPLALPVAWQVAPAIVVAAAPERQAGMGWSELAMLAWLAGALALATVLFLQQRRFHRGLGVLRRRADGLYESTAATAGLPAVAGVLRPRILLPADFGQRYSAQEQALVLQHERVHVRRGDLLANALVALLRCVFWFNPLLPFALRRFRLDQELACDEWVIARNPRARRQYGEAMLKTQFDELPLPLGCHWQARHPIKERIDMLKRPTPSPMRWMAAALLALGLSAAAGYTAWAAQPAQAPGAMVGTTFAIDVRLDVDGRSQSFQLREQAGRTFGIRSEEGGSPVWEAELAIKPLDDPGLFWIGGSVRADGGLVSEPALVATLGKPATIQLSTLDGRSVFTLEVNAKRLADAPPQASANGARAMDVEQASARAAGRTAVADDASAGSGDELRADPLAPLARERLPAPRYPEDAARAYINGKVLLRVAVDAEGRVTDVQVEESTPAGVFDAAAIEAARQWTFEPALQGGKPVAGQVRVPITFEARPAEQEGGNG
ncbi:TonB family protein [Pseudoxanthomonas daejeonensis]|uniref:TonB family protein n=1 Tax=Pseudoxanthomonas daejeonensis TaxID=266062 RepID=UPI001F5459CF|nr:TonB family protein [Pseudoxanthomonas daejeonensis]UNK58082.1 TonB family protein [Pseudoxanthomonas daejeonensis]